MWRESNFYGTKDISVIDENKWCSEQSVIYSIIKKKLVINKISNNVVFWHV